MKKKKQTFTESLRKNPWKAGTIVLTILLVIIIFYNLVIEPKATEQEEAERLCSIIRATPAWVNSNGGIIDYGVVNISLGLVSEILIPERIKFVYHSDCGACKKQIEYFGESWDDYVSSGLTIDCKEVEDLK